MIKYYYILAIVTLAICQCFAQSLHVTLHKTDAECDDGNATVLIDSGMPPFQVIWSTGAISSAITDLKEGDYSITVTDNSGQDTIINFSITQNVCKPNAVNYFTPNDDGISDTWSISRLENFPNFELFVFNKWGQQVHRQTQKYTPWDGTSINSAQPDGAYFYILYFDKKDKTQFIQGDVNIIR